jgi:hypothetical protein
MSFSTMRPVELAVAIAAFSILGLATAACGSDVHTGGGTGGDAGGGQGATGSTSSLTGTTSGSTGAGGQAACNPPPEDSPSAQSVTFAIANAASSDRYLVTSGHMCDAYGFERNQGGTYAAVPISMPFVCGCECPYPGDPHPIAYRRLKPAETYSVVWDARGLVTCAYSIDCGGGFSAPGLVGALQPLGAGDYRVTFGADEMPAMGCQPVDANGDEWQCPDFGSVGNPGAACGSAQTAIAEFALPSSGDLTVAVSLN